MKPLNTLITGGTGFLGTALKEKLRQQGHPFISLGSRDCDLTRQEALSPLNQVSFDRIFHLAAWTQAGDFCLRHPGQQWLNNQKINTNLLDWWQQKQPQAKLISMGTSCAYAPDRELTEDNYLKGEPIDSLYTYAMTKRMLLTGMQALAKQFELKYLCLVPSTLYGPGYHTDGRQMHFIFDLIRKILRGKLFNESVVLWGDGHQKRELVYVEDFASTALHLADQLENDLINIGAGEEYSIREFAALICEQTGYPAENIHYDTSRYVGAKSKVLSVAKLNSLYSGRPNTPLKQGLKQTIGWFLDNQDKLLPGPGISGAA